MSWLGIKNFHFFSGDNDALAEELPEKQNNATGDKVPQHHHRLRHNEVTDAKADDANNNNDDEAIVADTGDEDGVEDSTRDDVKTEAGLISKQQQ